MNNNWILLTCIFIAIILFNVGLFNAFTKKSSHYQAFGKLLRSTKNPMKFKDEPYRELSDLVKNLTPGQDDNQD